ncbi:MAG: urease accessory protein UreD [Boseongicola sp.]|nr:urease accessory protein UreD [Boseongicola sp.]MDD9977512.1 urease accessory protein UreD [Boseongicola sp.]
MSYQDVSLASSATVQPRAIGSVSLSTKLANGRSAIDRFRTSGASKVLFPNRRNTVEAIVINTSGGLTGGDKFDAEFAAGQGTELAITTQAAERAYRSISGHAEVTTRISVASRARAFWLPQELIIFEGSSLNRRLDVCLENQASFLMVEPVIFGRSAMGEALNSISFDDGVRIHRDGSPIYRDACKLKGDVESQLVRQAVCAGMRAMANVVFVASDAETKLTTVRSQLPTTGGASLLCEDILVFRIVAPDGFLLRRSLVPILEILRGQTLPRSWSL